MWSSLSPAAGTNNRHSQHDLPSRRLVRAGLPNRGRSIRMVTRCRDTTVYHSIFGCTDRDGERPLGARSRAHRGKQYLGLPSRLIDRTALGVAYSGLIARASCRGVADRSAQRTSSCLGGRWDRRAPLRFPARRSVPHRFRLARTSRALACRQTCIRFVKYCPDIFHKTDTLTEPLPPGRADSPRAYPSLVWSESHEPPRPQNRHRHHRFRHG
jgi:hypothetical protein